MGLLGSTTHYQYYNNQHKWLGSEGTTSGSIPRAIYTFDSDFTHTPADESEFTVTLNGEEQDRENYTYASGVITFQKKTVDNITSTLSASITIAEADTVIATLLTQVLGDYRYISLKDLVNNFMMGYVGDGKLVNTVKRSEVLFHTKRCIQEFNYDIGRVEKIQEVEVPPSLSIPMPQDYINYVKICWIDTAGIEHLLYPADYTSKPSESVLQDSNYEYLFTTEQDLITAVPSETSERFATFDSGNLSGSIPNDDYYYWSDNNTSKATNFGTRYGLEPKYANENGVFIIDELNGKITFDSNMSGKLVTLQYISDGLGTDAEMKIHKFAEEGMYKSLLHGILSTRAGVPEYIVQRYKREKRAAMRNAKLRLSNIKLAEMTQIMKGKNKWIK